MRRSISLLAAGCLLLACGGADETGGGPDAGTSEPDAAVDLTEALFDPDRIVEVDIEIAEADWDALRSQARTWDLFVGSDCLDEPFPKPYTYFSATVTVDGVRIENAGVRKKGFFGSLDDNKPSLKIKLDEYVPGQKVHGSSRLTLNNAKQDRSFIKQCMGYQIFAQAGIPTPRCNFAHVTVNGIDKGLFANVESVKKPFLRRHFASDEGNLYEGTLSDFRFGWIGTFEKKTNEADPSRPEIVSLTDALERSDAQLLDALEPIIDVDQFIDFWATEVIIAHWDGYANNANNFFIYGEPGGRLTFMPWGIDGILADANPFPDGPAPPKAVFATGLLARRLYLLPETRFRYLTRLTQLLDELWDEQALIGEIDRMESLVIDIASSDPFATDIDVGAEIEKVRQFVRDRRAMLAPELANPPQWTYPLRETFCLATIGNLQGTFATTWGTLDSPDPFVTGTGTLSGSAEGNPVVPTAVGSKAGLNTEGANGPRAQVQVAAWLPNGLLVVFAVEVPPVLFGAGTLPFDLSSVPGYLLEWNPATNQSRLVGVLWGGSVTFNAASMTDGSEVSGSFSGTLVEVPF